TALPESFYGVFNPFAVALHNIIPFKNEYLKAVISYPQVWRHLFLLHPKAAWSNYAGRYQ
ncbi:MAG: hypothetical protein LLF76_01340, partial [Planctomycetaceae bacterium]|nr:hypothetical protein [Planctomycetaceae bacterium]